MEKTTALKRSRRLSSFCEKKIDASGLAVFRIFYSSVLFLEVCQFIRFRHLMFDPVPFLEPFELNLLPVLAIWPVAILLLIFGAFTRTAAIINYIFSLLFFGSISSFEYHMFYAYMGINALLIFLPVSKLYSMDRLMLKLKYSNTRFQYTPPTTVPVLAYYMPLLLGVGFVYFDSIFYKLSSPMWLKGLGVWMPSSLPIAAHVNSSWILNNEIIIKFIGYLTIAFEGAFIFLFWFRKWRVVLLVIGLVLHIGIFIQFPIPFFALGVISIYTLLVPVSWWTRKSRKNAPPLKVFYDAECPLCIRTKIIVDSISLSKQIKFLNVQAYADGEEALKNIDRNELLNNIYSVDKNGKVFKGIDTYIKIFMSIWYLAPFGVLVRIPGIYHLSKRIYAWIASNRIVERCTEETCGYTPPTVPQEVSKIKIFRNLTVGQVQKFAVTLSIFVLFLLQFISSFNSVVTVTNSHASISPFVLSIEKKVNNFSQTYLGITAHAVFMDYHFKDYRNLIAVVYKDVDGKETHLPIVDEKGNIGSFIYGANWVKWTFRVNGRTPEIKTLNDGLKRFTAFWSYINRKSFDNSQFIIKVKKIDAVMEWEKDFLNRQLQKPWIEVGSVFWKSGNFVALEENNILSFN
jgi:predicted DCC family thiol-disulfide oxidoreductase YuxK